MEKYIFGGLLQVPLVDWFKEPLGEIGAHWVMPEKFSLAISILMKIVLSLEEYGKE